MSPLDYMLKVMRDETAESWRRDRMAQIAAPYLHPEIAAIDKRDNDGQFRRGQAMLGTHFRAGKDPSRGGSDWGLSPSMNATLERNTDTSRAGWRSLPTDAFCSARSVWHQNVPRVSSPPDIDG